MEINIHTHLMKIDMSYRVWYRKVQELEQKSELSSGEENELDDLKELLEEKRNDITLGD